ncbi:transglutaminase-like domain-containing protein [Luteibaculum oceani]|uniref:Protein SirB1 N-terminal domain-containing protein n=1 Tax=Luteibaculum oceani TaxID=1294296 RepID=A0A5C6VAV8_9FLAO|nr:transglutaminase-like domain-containing protein [Luteibaculum oceani]TXC81974.1 hypothetical protein FRX97_02470 [Luteibaculum oceani]
MKRLNALIQLLDDPDQQIADQVTQEIIAIGDKAIPQLEKFWEENSFEPNFRDRVEDLVHTIQFNGVVDGLKNWISDDSDLLEGAFWISKYLYPDLELKDLKSSIKAIADLAAVNITEDMTSRHLIGAINEVLYDKLGYRSNKKHFHAPQNNMISEVINSRKGNPLLLSVMYILVATELKVPVCGVNLPNHFVTGYLSSEGKILFYINPFNKGSLLTRQDLVIFLKEMKIPMSDQFLDPCSNKDMVKRMVVNLIYSYTKLGHDEKVEELRVLETLFD